MFKNFQPDNLLLLLRREVLLLVNCGLWGDIHFVEKVGKEDEVGNVHEQAGKQEIRSLRRAVDDREDDEECAKHHLAELPHGDALARPLRPADMQGRAHVIGVHKGVDDQVHHRIGSTALDLLCPGGPTEPHGDDVVVVLQESERTLAEHDENGVEELWNLAHAEVESPRIAKLDVAMADLANEAATHKPLVDEFRHNLVRTVDTENS